MKFDEDTKLEDVWRSFREEALPAITPSQRAFAMLGFYGCSAAMMRMVSFLNNPDEFVDRMRQFQQWGQEAEDFISRLASEAEEKPE